MKNLSDFIHKLEKHETKDVIDNHINGSLTVIWRDYDKIIASAKSALITDCIYSFSFSWS